MAMAVGASMKALLRDTVIYGIGNFSSIIVSFLLIPVLTRTLNTQGYGTLALANVIIVLSSNILGLGLGSSVFNELLHAKSEENKKQIIGTVFILLACAGSLSALIGFTLLVAKSSFIFNTFTGTTYVYMVLSVITGLAIPVLFSILRAENKVEKFSLLGILGAVIALLLTFYFVLVARENVAGVLKARVWSAVLTLFLGWISLRGFVSLSFSPAFAKKLLTFGLPLVPSSLMMWVLDLSDRFFIQAFRSTNEVGIYSLGYQYASVLSLPLVAFQLAWPQVLVEYSKEKEGHYKVGNIFRYYVLFASSGALFLIAFSKELMAVLGSASFLDARIIVPPVVVGYIFFGFYLLGSAGNYLKKETRWMPLITLSGCFVNVTGNVLFVPSYGMIASAFATLAAYMVMAFIMWLSVYRVYPVSFPKRALLMRGALFACVLALVLYFQESFVILRVILLLLFALLYYALSRLETGRAGIFIKKDT